LLQARAADILIPDVQPRGGPTEFLKASALCKAFNTPISPYPFREVSLPLLAALPNALYLEYMPWFDSLYGQGSCWMERVKRLFQSRRVGAQALIQPLPLAKEWRERVANSKTVCPLNTDVLQAALTSGPS
jgi:hypothetical protein